LFNNILRTKVWFNLSVCHTLCALLFPLAFTRRICQGKKINGSGFNDCMAIRPMTRDKSRLFF
jgi:hypothetical protein